MNPCGKLFTTQQYTANLGFKGSCIILVEEMIQNFPFFQVTIGELSPSSLFEGFFEHIVSRPRYCIGFCNEDWLSRTDIFSKKGENGV